MAQEIIVQTLLGAQKGNLNVGTITDSLRPDLAGSHHTAGEQDVPTTAAGTAIAFGSGVAAAGGWAYFKNIDAVHYIEIGVQVAGTFYPVAKLLPGEVAMFRTSVLTLFARANAATSTLEFNLLDA